MTIANKILMIRPVQFGFNPQTAESNSFQKKINLEAETIQKKALEEFNLMAKGLQNLGIEVLIFEDTKEKYTPDSVFPNNWFSTHPNGTFCLYPMEAEARRFEREGKIIDELKKEFNPKEIFDLTSFENEGKFLEGTGSLVLDYKNKIAYASISSRTNPKVLDIWVEKLGFELVKFTSFDENKKAIYHTNVMMCLGDKFAVVCLKSIVDKIEREKLVQKLRETNKEIIKISHCQMNNFAGNMLLLKNKLEEKFLVMSESAFNSLNDLQIKKLKTHAKLVLFDIETIETCGGGSARCMIAEIFN